MKINADMINPSVSLDDNRLELAASVVDARIQKNVNPEFNGFEKVFALIPERDDAGSLQWKRYDLQYEGTYATRFDNTVRDTHGLRLDIFDVDARAIAQHGVAFGADIDGGGTVWCQTSDDNFKVR